MYNTIKKKHPELKMVNATSKVKNISDFYKFEYECAFNKDYKNLLLYFEPDLNNEVWKNITIEIFQQQYSIPCARWIVLYLDNYSHGTMNTIKGDLQAVLEIIDIKYKKKECIICTEEKSTNMICSICTKSVCDSCSIRIVNMKNSNYRFICPFCRSKPDNEICIVKKK